MPLYTYRREDGTTFDIRQSFSDEPLKVDPATGQPVTRIVQAAGIIFKGSGFYVNDSKGKSSTMTPPKAGSDTKAETPAASETKSESAAPAASTPSTAPAAS
jgi:putative FmdB family regulatory protein